MIGLVHTHTHMWTINVARKPSWYDKNLIKYALIFLIIDSDALCFDKDGRNVVISVFFLLTG